MLELLSFISLSTIAFMLVTLWALWILYVAMMNIKSVSDRGPLPWQSKIIVYPTTIIFSIVEVLANCIVCTIIFLDMPKEITVSSRLRRYNTNPSTLAWRMSIVKFVKPMLDPFDPEGPHI